MRMSEPALILAVGTAVLAILFAGRRLAIRAGGGVAQPSESGNASTARRSGAPDVPGVIALPPFIFLGFLAAAAVLEAIVPLPLFGSHAIARYVAGALLAVGGFVMIGLGARGFVGGGPNVPPNRPARAAVRDGHYRWTREP